MDLVSALSTVWLYFIHNTSQATTIVLKTAVKTSGQQHALF